MHRHLQLVMARPKSQRPAKVISLEVRRKARREQVRPQSPHKRPAAVTQRKRRRRAVQAPAPRTQAPPGMSILDMPEGQSL